MTDLECLDTHAVKDGIAQDACIVDDTVEAAE